MHKIFALIFQGRILEAINCLIQYLHKQVYFFPFYLSNSQKYTWDRNLLEIASMVPSNIKIFWYWSPLYKMPQNLCLHLFSHTQIYTQIFKWLAMLDTLLWYPTAMDNKNKKFFSTNICTSIILSNIFEPSLIESIDTDVQIWWTGYTAYGLFTACLNSFSKLPV